MRHRLLLIAACGVLALCACAKPRETAVKSSDVPASIIATDSGYAAPDTLHAGLNHIAYENRGSTIHECMFIRLPDGMNGADYVAAVRAGREFPEGAIDCSGPGLTSPQERVEIWLPLEPGRYLLACWFKDHLLEMTPRTIIVEGAPPVPVVAPHEDATLRLIDFRYELVGHITRGIRTIRVETVGPSMHEADFYRLDGGRTIDDLRVWHTNHREGPLPATVMGGVLDSHDLSHVVYLRRNFTIGHYVVWCSMPMIQHGNTAHAGAAANVTHAQAGMVMEFEVGM